MRSGIVLSSDEVKKIIAEHYNVHEDDVIKAKYSYVVLDVKCGDIMKDEFREEYGGAE